jgi:hypothetical protein
MVPALAHIDAAPISSKKALLSDFHVQAKASAHVVSRGSPHTIWGQVVPSDTFVSGKSSKK